MASLEGAYEQVNYRLNSIDSRLNSIEARFISVDGRFDALEERFSSIDSRFNHIETKIDQRFMWTIGAILASWTTTIFAIYSHH